MFEGIKALLLEEYTPEQWALAFFLYSFAGWCWEVALSFILRHRFVNRGFLTGPILPIYGFGALTILIVCVPVKDSVLLVALAGAVGATVLEYVTGAAMEALFHVRYWDYSRARFNVHGYGCAKSTAVWALFSALIVRLIHPFVREYVQMIPTGFSTVLAGSFTAFALADTVSAVRRAFDLRALLMSMERYAKELEALHGGLDSVADRVADMIRAFARTVDARHEEAAQRLASMNETRERIAQQIRERRITLEEGAKERFAAFEHALAGIADLTPDAQGLHEELRAIREKYDRQAEVLRAARERRLARARKVLHRNPSAASRRYSSSFAALRDEEESERRTKR